MKQLVFTPSRSHAPGGDAIGGERQLNLMSDALENSPTGFHIFTVDGKLLYANRTYLEMWGYRTIGEACQKSLRSRFADPPVIDKLIRNLVECGQDVREATARHKDGRASNVVERQTDSRRPNLALIHPLRIAWTAAKVETQ